jgi:exopolyphosphatase/guanosine-5'-triphosphate,3'-diphosphate pyrophosphatase
MLIPGMIEMRVEMIVVACLLIKFILEKLEIQELRISGFSLKEGVLYSIINSLQKK